MQLFAPEVLHAYLYEYCQQLKEELNPPGGGVTPDRHTLTPLESILQGAESMQISDPDTGKHSPEANAPPAARARLIANRCEKINAKITMRVYGVDVLGIQIPLLVRWCT